MTSHVILISIHMLLKTTWMWQLLSIMLYICQFGYLSYSNMFFLLFFAAFLFCLFYQLLKEALKSLIMIVNLPISPFTSVSFA